MPPGPTSAATQARASDTAARLSHDEQRLEGLRSQARNRGGVGLPDSGLASAGQCAAVGRLARAILDQLTALEAVGYTSTSDLGVADLLQGRQRDRDSLRSAPCALRAAGAVLAALTGQVQRNLFDLRQLRRPYGRRAGGRGRATAARGARGRRRRAWPTPTPSSARPYCVRNRGSELV